MLHPKDVLHPNHVLRPIHVCATSHTSDMARVLGYGTCTGKTGINMSHEYMRYIRYSSTVHVQYHVQVLSHVTRQNDIQYKGGLDWRLVSTRSWTWESSYDKTKIYWRVAMIRPRSIGK